MKFFKYISFLSLCFLFGGCIGNMNPTGGNSSPDYPYFITKEPMTVKKIAVPVGTRLTYEEHFMKNGEQDKMLSMGKLTSIKLPEGETIDWGGVPVYWIYKFFNSEMRGFSVYGDFENLSSDKHTKFSRLWQSCSEDIGVMVRNMDDWSFNKNNISDVNSCSVNYQRYFKDNKEQQSFLDSMYFELQNVNSK